MSVFKRHAFYPVLLAALVSIAQADESFVKQLLTLPEDKIDVGIVALTLAKEIYPDIDIASYSAKIDSLAEQVRRLARGTQDPDQRIRCLNTVLFLHEKIRANPDSSFPRKQANYFLNRVLDTKQGNCFTMPLLYVVVVQRLGWPVYLVRVPDHSFVRYVDPNFKQKNIEATSGGGYVPDEKYAKDFCVSEAGRKSGAYLRTLTYRELLGDLVATNGINLGLRGQLPRAITYLKLATRFDPRLVGAWANLVNANMLMAKRSTGPEAEKYLQMAENYSKKLDELGFVDPRSVP